MPSYKQKSKPGLKSGHECHEDDHEENIVVQSDSSSKKSEIPVEEVI